MIWKFNYTSYNMIQYDATQQNTLQYEAGVNQTRTKWRITHSLCWWGSYWGPPLWRLHPGPLGPRLSWWGIAAGLSYPPGTPGTPAERPHGSEPAGPGLGSRSLGRGAAWWRTAWGALVQTGLCRAALEAPQEHFLEMKANKKAQQEIYCSIK